MAGHALQAYSDDPVLAVAVELVEAGDHPEQVYVDLKRLLRDLAGRGTPQEPDAPRIRLLATFVTEADTGRWGQYLAPDSTALEGLRYRLDRAEQVFVATGAARQDPTDLYRWYDHERTLIYIGITGSLARRQDAHGVGSTWTEFAATCSVDRLPARGVALVHEKYAIRRELPIFNKQHNDTPESCQRLVKYLADRGRYDLLAPVIKRG